MRADPFPLKVEESRLPVAGSNCAPLGAGGRVSELYEGGLRVCCESRYELTLECWCCISIEYMATRCFNLLRSISSFVSVFRLFCTFSTMDSR